MRLRCITVVETAKEESITQFGSMSRTYGEVVDVELGVQRRQPRLQRDYRVWRVMLQCLRGQLVRSVGPALSVTQRLGGGSYRVRAAWCA